VLLVGALVLGGAAACTGESAAPAPQQSQAAPNAGQKPITLAVTPKSGAKNLPVSAEVALAYSGGWVSSVAVTKAGSSRAVKGSMRPDLTSWVPAQPLEYGSTYTANVTVTADDGVRTQTRRTTFSTMSRPGRQTGYGMYLFGGQTYGVGLPIVLEFDPPIPPSARAGVERRLFVKSTPAQPGVWHWASGSQVWYRPPEYWKPGTVVSMRAALKGVPFGGGWYGDTDKSATVTIGRKIVMNVDNKTKQMSVYRDDKLVRRIPVSLGKPSTPSSSGSMVVMSHDYTTVFDTTREGPGGYRVQVSYAMRLTWGGEFIHAAPWSVGDQGVRNVSHGCVNMSMGNAAWLFGITHIGDLVNVKGTEVRLVNGNGWTAWNVSWPEFVKGSALPVPAELANWAPVTAKPASAPTKAPAAAPSPSPGG
jgi:lipoprotein-anchoring transpeptidase ErfK/SrfK